MVAARLSGPAPRGREEPLVHSVSPEREGERAERKQVSGRCSPGLWRGPSVSLPSPPVFSALIPWAGVGGKRSKGAEKPGASASVDSRGRVEGQAGISGALGPETVLRPVLGDAGAVHPPCTPHLPPSLSPPLLVSLDDLVNVFGATWPPLPLGFPHVPGAEIVEGQLAPQPHCALTMAPEEAETRPRVGAAVGSRVRPRPGSCHGEAPCLPSAVSRGVSGRALSSATGRSGINLISSGARAAAAAVGHRGRERARLQLGERLPFPRGEGASLFPGDLPWSHSLPGVARGPSQGRERGLRAPCRRPSARWRTDRDGPAASPARWPRWTRGLQAAASRSLPQPP